MRLFIFDLDGTLRITRSGRPCPNHYSDQELLPGVSINLRDLYVKNKKIAVASNQGGVSFGFMSEMACWKSVLYLDDMLGNRFDDVRMNFYHEKGFFSYRHKNRAKPRPDMLVELMDDLDCRPNRTMFIGNQFLDYDSAIRAQVNFAWAHEFFNWPKNFVVETENGFFPKRWYEKWEKRKRDGHRKRTAAY